MRVLVLDNYDSFTYNLVQYICELGAETEVIRNDGASIPKVAAARYDCIVVSPGPGTPSRAGISVPLVREMAGKAPLLGVCLGHQAVGVAFGCRVVRAPAVFHGKTSHVHHDGRTIFRGLPNPFPAGRYHSLVVDPDSLPSCLEVSARTGDGVIMGIRHRDLRVEGIQFHPESILTPGGMRLMANFLEWAA